MSRESKRRYAQYVGKPCMWCKTPMTLPAKSDSEFCATAVSEEHIYPRSKKGPNEAWNIGFACTRCNNIRGNLDREIFEMFARDVIQQYPLAPMHVLREALQQFVTSLAEIAIRNKRESRRAISLSLLSVAEKLRKL